MTETSPEDLRKAMYELTGVESKHDDLPKEMFFFLTDDLGHAAWNIDVIGHLGSAATAAISDSAFREVYLKGEEKWLMYEPTDDVSTGFLSTHQLHTLTNFQAEYMGELVRKVVSPLLPSRLSCVYLWGSLADALRANERSGSKYKLKNLRKAAPQLVLRATKANVDIIRIARQAARGMNGHGVIEHIWGQYWNGSAERVGYEYLKDVKKIKRDTLWTRKPVLWEWLVDGTFNVDKSWRYES